MKTKLSLLFVALISAVASLSAADFTVGGIAYTITSSTSPYTVAVSESSPAYSGAVTIPANVTYNTVTYSVTSIEDFAFYGCSSLTSISIPNSVMSIEDGAFCNCSSLTSVTIPNSVTSIGDDAFSGCSGLTSMTIPNSVTSIGNSAFNSCSGLTSVIIPNSVTFIGNYAFCLSSGLINVDSSNPNYSSLDGVLFNKTQTNLIQCPISKSGNYIIPNSVTSIDGGAFAGCSGLTSIYAGSATPIDLSSSSNVFYDVDKTACTLYVPVGSKSLYAAADQWKDFVNIVEGIPAGTEEKTVSSIALFPNPATTYLTLKGIEKETTLNVFTLSGKKVLEINVQPNEKISVANWSKGIYLLKVNETTTRLVVE